MKTYELKTEEQTEGKPHLIMTGQRTITFDCSDRYESRAELFEALG